MLNGVPQVYILAGGVIHWLDFYGSGKHPATLPAIAATGTGDTLRHEFAMALGSRATAADTELAHVPKYEFTRKVHLPKPITNLRVGYAG